MDQPPSDNQAPRSLAWLYFLTFFVIGFGPSIIGPTLLGLAEQTGSDLQDIGIIFSMRSLGYLISARIIGGIYDRRPGHPIMAIALGLCSLLFVSMPFILNLWVLSGTFLLTGIFSAFVDLGGNILLIWAFHKNSGPYLNGLHFSFGLGAVTAPLLVAFTLNAGQPATFAYWIVAAFSLPSILWLLSRTSPVNPYEAPGASATDATPGMSIWLLVGFFFLYGGSEVAIGGWIHTYGIRHNNMPDARAAYLTSSFWGLFTVGRLLAIPLAARYRSHQLIRMQLLGASVFLLVLVLSPPREVVTWTCAMLIGLCLSSIFPLAMTYFKRFTAGSGQLTSWFFVGASAGSMTIPWLIGRFFEQVGPNFFTAFVLVCIIAALFIISYTSRYE